MNTKFIPFEWWHEPPKYFITYYGDILFGRVVEQYEDGSFYILTNNKAHEFRNRNDEIKYEELCDKIPCKHMIIGEPVEKLSFTDIQYPQGISTSDEVYSKLFVFGAGASRYCIFDDEKETFEKDFQWKPPLGFEIFHRNYTEIINRYPEIKTYIPYYIYHQKDIEYALEAEWQDITSCYNPSLLLRHTQVMFYIRDLIRKVSEETIRHFNNNLYCLLMDKLNRYLCKNKNERIILVSFNYDTILDHYIQQIFGYQYNTLNDYIDNKNNKVILVKPHGSWDWGWKINKEEIQKSSLYSYITENKLTLADIYYNLISNFAFYSWGYEAMLNEKRIGRYKPNRNAISRLSNKEMEHSFPAILMPYRNKDEIMMSYKMFDASCFLVNKIKEVYLIGWKGNERIFNEYVLSKTEGAKKVIIVNPNPDEVKKNINIPFKGENITYNRFEEFVTQHTF
jgi:hypothetical protein